MNFLKRRNVEVKRGGKEIAIYGLACAYSFIEKIISECLKPFNLTPAKFNALMIIKHKGGDTGLSQIEIGRSLIVTASNMTRLLDRMHKEGLIERLSQKGDRRINLIRISSKGSDILDKAWPGYYKKVGEIAGFLSSNDLKQFRRLILGWCVRLENSAELAKIENKKAGNV